ncbi:uncharacterized protein LOC108471944 [Gossypium arboreum]|uniref:RNase H type-1 domain-containing protein n=1 Tax=Gossypium arboreum TaxID=29729 RepID=A0ABR0QT08_GOSAR|nr:uncharacterized protein LOC108471944 [Gossypium arboreum]KAK5842443.1 hypothetical protein PVK06_004799 [Gossypium arboreum]
MQYRKLATDTICPRCGASAETMDHLFRECPVTVEAWTALSLQHIVRIKNMDFVQWLTWVFNQLTPCQCCLFCCTLWAIWGDRNKRIHEKTVSTGKDIAKLINSFINELNVFKKRKLAKTTEPSRWRHPTGEFIKINFDCAYNEGQNCSALGIVARDADGTVLLSYLEIHQGIASAFAAEAIACWKAVQLGIEKGWQSIIVEGDSLTIIKKYNTEGQDRSLIGAYIYDIKQQIKEPINITFKHILRSVNTLVHILATVTLRRKEEIYLEKTVPEYAEEQMRREWEPN